jgi:hypothetical protein
MLCTTHGGSARSERSKASFAGARLRYSRVTEQGKANIEEPATLQRDGAIARRWLVEAVRLS